MIYIFFLFIFVFTFNNLEDKSFSITCNIIIFLTSTLITAEILSLFTIFNVLTLRIITPVFLLGYIGLYFSKYRSDIFKRAFISIKNTFSLPALIIFGLLSVSAFFYLPSNYDSNTYHLPRFIHWLQNGHLNHYTTSIFRQVYQPYLNEIFLSFIYSSLGAYSLLNFWQVIFLYFGYLVLLDINNSIPEKYKISTKNILLPFLLCWSLLLQSVTTKNDVILLFFILYIIYLVIDFRKKPQIGLIILSSVLGCLTKGTMNVYIIAIILVFFGISIRFKIFREYLEIFLLKVQIKQFLLFSAISALLLFPTIYRNISLVGNIFGQDETELSSFQNTYKSFSVGVSNTIKNLGYQSFTPFGNPISTEEVELLHYHLGLPNVNDSSLNYLGREYNIPELKKFEGFLCADIVPNLLVLYLTVGLVILTLVKLLSKGINKQSIVFLKLTFISLFILYIFSFLLRWQPWHTRLLFPVFLLQSFAIINYLEKTKLFFLLKTLIMIVACITIVFNAQQPLISLHNITEQFPNFWNSSFWNVALENKVPKYEKNEFRYAVIRKKIGLNKTVGIICGLDDRVFGYMLNHRKTNNKYYYMGEVKNPTDKLAYKNPKIDALNYMIVNLSALEDKNLQKQFNSFETVLDTTNMSKWILLRNNYRN
jgi:hypothetical protein